MMTSQDPDTFTYRGRSLEELVPRIRAELGDDAVIVARRETTSGGVGGFFARREIEVDVRPGSAAAARAFAEQLQQAAERQQQEAGGADLLVPRMATAPEIDALPASTDVSVDDLFPPPPAQAQEGLAALFNAGLQAPVPPEVQPPVVPEPPEPVAVEPEPEPEATAPPEIPQPEQPTGEFDYLGHVEPEPEPEPVVPEPIVEGPAKPIAPPRIHLPSAAREATERLVARGLREGLAGAIAEEAIASLAPLLPDADPKELVVDALARRIPQHPLRRGPGVIGFVGTGGAGKTRCAARLAAAHARHGALPVWALTVRSADEGAELKRLLAPYGVEVIAVDSGAEGAARIAALRGQGLVIVDTPGVSPGCAGELHALGDELRTIGPDEVHLTVPAIVGPEAARELVHGVRELGVTAVAVTHTDETEILGTVIGLAIDCDLPLSYLARGQAVEAGLKPACAPQLAADLVP